MAAVKDMEVTPAGTMVFVWPACVAISAPFRREMSTSLEELA
jgi:hypothetical protein